MSFSLTSEFIGNFPKKYIVRAGRLLGTIAYMLDTRHRRIVIRNLQFIYSDWSRDKILKLAKNVFQNFGITVLEICQMTCYSKEDIQRKVKIKGKENLLNALESPKGLIFISAHIGNWEMAPQVVACCFNHPITSIARRLQSKTLEGFIYRLRTRFDNKILDKKGGLSKMARILRHGGTLGMLIDQGTKLSKGMEVSFFKKTVTTTPAAAILARRYDCVVLPSFCVRGADGELNVIVEEPLDMQKTHDSRADHLANTQIMTNAIQKAVSTYPEQWFWFHKRWKRHYPHLYPEDLLKRRLRKEKRIRLRRSDGVI
jgi:KDO2-lipid IV(A) lauroyltransferase